MWQSTMHCHLRPPDAMPLLTENVYGAPEHERHKFLPTLTMLLCPSPSHTLYAALTWRLTATLNEMALGLPAAQI